MLFLESDLSGSNLKKSVRSTRSARPRRRQRILVVDDDADVRRLNTEVLTYAGYQVDAADSGATGWEVLQINNYDLMVTDNNMPKMTGLELIKKMRDNHLMLPVIMATGKPPALEPTKDHLLQPVVLLKPYTVADLLKTVKNVLDSNK
jgi:DNA-binding response OmpR family regulator